MTTEKMIFTSNMNQQNEVYFLGGRARCDLASVAYIFDGWESKLDTTVHAIKKLSGRVAANIPDFNHWLFVGHRNWNNDTSVIRHKKLWHSMKEQGINIPFGDNMSEVLIKLNGKVKYFGLLRCLFPEFESISHLMRSGWEAQLLLMNDGDAAYASECLLSQGWSRHGNAPPDELLNLLCARDILSYLPLGWFDDRESGCALIAQKSLLSTCFPEI